MVLRSIRGSSKATLTLVEDLVLDPNIVTLGGGRNCEYTTNNSASTTINGIFPIKSRTVTVKHIIIRAK